MAGAALAQVRLGACASAAWDRRVTDAAARQEVDLLFQRLAAGAPSERAEAAEIGGVW